MPRPRWGQAAGALALFVSLVCIDLSGADAGTASAYRCLPAVPALVLALPEYRRAGRPPRPQVLYGLAGGALFAGDMLLWAKAITEVGAALSTVLVNVQVVLVSFLARAVDRERVPRRFLLWLPVLLAGVVLTGGLFEQGASGGDPTAGAVQAVLAALSYSGFLFLLRRGGFAGHVRTTYTLVICVSSVVSALGGAVWGTLGLAPSWRTLGWLAVVALSSQIVGWLLVAVNSPRLPSHIGAVLLLLTPVGALALGALVLGERPTPAQWLGCGLIMLSAYVTTGGAPGNRDGGGPQQTRTSSSRSRSRGG
ncbi:DMT family transporter [Streptomyces sp. V4I2]|uniref:DMT family transporter n=1 Tax=Streptomyces sp. V4I2 TaxID=3042280 RepID=UPI002785C004|nr:DMT family transporter [Streptomyces sp. V4I2]MDQ1042563.1 drug/metabolite transporter (DMT)-like permease [Streptomyces sp. V4I2]